jgi:hypothetical protein
VQYKKVVAVSDAQLQRLGCTWHMPLLLRCRLRI